MPLRQVYGFPAINPVFKKAVTKQPAEGNAPHWAMICSATDRAKLAGQPGIDIVESDYNESASLGRAATRFVNESSTMKTCMFMTRRVVRLQKVFL